MEMSDVKPRIILVFFLFVKKGDELDICQIGIFYRSEGLSAEIVTKVFFLSVSKAYEKSIVLMFF